MKKKNREKLEAAERAVAKARADRVELLATVQRLEAEKKQTEEEAEELIGLAAIVGEKLDKSRPHVEALRKALAALPDGWLSMDEDARALTAAVQHAWKLAEALSGPIVLEGKDEWCFSSASLQVQQEGAFVTVTTKCWGEKGHEGPHGDEEGRSW